MKKFLFLLLAGVTLSTAAYAKHHCNCEGCGRQAEYKNSGKGGFFDTTAKPTGVADLKKLNDDAIVVLEGYIVRQISDDEYTFTDNTGTVTVEIDEKDWRGQRITPKNKIMLKGTLDKDDDALSVDVKSLSIVN